VNRKEAREELDALLTNQKTVSIPRLKRIIAVIDIDGCERQRVEMGKKIKKLRERIK
jgi:uncharacterized protein YqgV (UPF0045/DUF77 family)